MVPKFLLFFLFGICLLAARPVAAETPAAPASAEAGATDAREECQGRFARLKKWARAQAYAMKKAPPIDRKALREFYDRKLIDYIPKDLQEKIARATASGEPLAFSEAEVESLREALRLQLEHYYKNFLANDPHLLDMKSFLERAATSPDNPLQAYKSFQDLGKEAQLKLLNRPLSGTVLDFQLAAGPTGGVLNNSEMASVMESGELPGSFAVKSMMELIKRNYGKLAAASGGMILFQPLKKQFSNVTGAMGSVGDVGVSRALAQKNAESFALLGKKMVSPEQKRLAREQMEKLLGKMTDEQFDTLVTRGVHEMLNTHFFEESSNIPLMRIAREERQEVVGLFGGMISSIQGIKGEIARAAKAAAWAEASSDPDKAEVLRGLADAKAAAFKQLEWQRQQMMYLLIDRAYGLSGETPAMNPKLREAFELAASPSQLNGELLWKTHYLETKTELAAIGQRSKEPVPVQAEQPAPAPLPKKASRRHR